jgi:hypothetical protein
MTDRQLAWTMLYSSILGIAHHPRQMQEPDGPMTPAEAARRTNEAMIEWDRMYGARD